MKSVAFHNLGCKVNSYEIEVMQQYFQKNGYSIVDFAQKADIYVINTCTVTNIADRKSRQMIHRAKSLNPGALIVAVGCYVQTHEQEVLKDDSIDLAVGNNKKGEIVELVEAFLREQKDKTLGGRSIADLEKEVPYEEMQLDSTAEHTRVYLKIQDGCNQFCSYCAIPLARGRVRSRKPEQILREAQRMAEKGYREIVITGIHISSYGMDFDGVSYNSAIRGENYHHSRHLLGLLQSLSQIEGLERIRLSSLEPRIITPEFAERLSGIPGICPHFHLSLQSGSDSVLKRMNRQYTTDDFRQSVALLRQFFDRPAITTDIIAGFPGETEEEFKQTLSFAESIGFYEMHVFPFSRRKGTAADRMPGQLTEKEKKERCRRLLELDQRLCEAYRRQFAGTRMEVLWECEKQLEGERWLCGHTTNYIEVALANPAPDEVGSITGCVLSDRQSEGIVIGDRRA